MLKSLQFELWEDCNSGCKFCYLGKYRDTSPITKIKSLQSTIEKISDMSIYNNYNVLSYIGGEFFQGQLNDPTVRKLFFELIDKTAYLSDNNYLKQVWITTTMTIGN
jgi:sulfatase maturation enzyme AslB (radical SAM superfamily)